MSPRISAPTVAEHRARQRTAILAAARSLLEESGPEAVTHAAVGSAIGLARSSVYDYFPSAADLLAELVRDAFVEWTAHVQEAVDGAGPGLPRLEAYVRTVLRLAASGRHKVRAIVDDATLPAVCREHLALLHAELQAPVREALTELRVTSPEVTATLVDGVVTAAIRLIGAGADADEVADAALQLLRTGAAPGPSVP